MCEGCLDGPCGRRRVRARVCVCVDRSVGASVRLKTCTDPVSVNPFRHGSLYTLDHIPYSSLSHPINRGSFAAIVQNKKHTHSKP